MLLSLDTERKQTSRVRREIYFISGTSAAVPGKLPFRFYPFCFSRCVRLTVALRFRWRCTWRSRFQQQRQTNTIRLPGDVTFTASMNAPIKPPHSRPLTTQKVLPGCFASQFLTILRCRRRCAIIRDPVSQLFRVFDLFFSLILFFC